MFFKYFLNISILITWYKRYAVFFCSSSVICLISNQMILTSRAHFLSHISVSHPQPSVLIVSYIESAKAAAQFGFYQKAEWKPDDSMIAVAVSTPFGNVISYLQFDWSAYVLPQALLLQNTKVDTNCRNVVLTEFPWDKLCRILE